MVGGDIIPDFRRLQLALFSVIGVPEDFSWAQKNQGRRSIRPGFRSGSRNVVDCGGIPDPPVMEALNSLLDRQTGFAFRGLFGFPVMGCVEGNPLAWSLLGKNRDFRLFNFCLRVAVGS